MQEGHIEMFVELRKKLYLNYKRQENNNNFKKEMTRSKCSPIKASKK